MSCLEDTVQITPSSSKKQEMDMHVSLIVSYGEDGVILWGPLLVTLMMIYSEFILQQYLTSPIIAQKGNIGVQNQEHLASTDILT